jgi:hypothetical protein
MGSEVGLEGVLLAVTQSVITEGTFNLAIGDVGHIDISRKSLVRCFPQEEMSTRLTWDRWSAFW